jgi:hypothetical protein
LTILSALFRGRTLETWTVPRADVGGHHKPGISRRSTKPASLARHGSSMK